jgi:Carboxypeptidase regulatory-like domain
MTRICITATMAAVLSLGAFVPAAAQGPATMRGQVFDCTTGAPFAGAAVTLQNREDGTTITLRADEHGRFVRVGLVPGTYSVGATNPTGPWRHTVHRLARLESDDVLDVPIGMWGGLTTRELCVPYRVPPALSTSDRYIIR